MSAKRIAAITTLLLLYAGPIVAGVLAGSKDFVILAVIYPLLLVVSVFIGLGLVRLFLIAIGKDNS